MNREASSRLTRNGKTAPFQCEQGVNGAFASPLPLSHLTLHTLALSTENDLNSVAIFEDV